MMKEIDDDLTDYLDANKIMAQMSAAFSGNNEKPKKDPLLESKSNPKLRKGAGLDPILEETPGTIVPFTNNMSL